MEKVGHCVFLEPLTQPLPVFFLSASLHHEVKNPVSSPTAMVLRHLGPNDQDRSLRNHEPNKQTNKQETSSPFFLLIVLSGILITKVADTKIICKT